jgi:hypothetical protein
MLDSTRYTHPLGGEIMKKMLYIVASALTFLVLSQPASAASSAHIGTAKEHCNNMVMAGESGMDHGGQGHTDTAVNHFRKMAVEAQECLTHGQEALKASDAGKDAQMHGKEAMTHVQEALKHATSATGHGEAGHNDVMMQHGKEAMMHASEGNKHMKGMK